MNPEPSPPKTDAPPKRSVAVACAKLMIVAVWLFLIGLMVATAAELYLRPSKAPERKTWPNSTSSLAELQKGYEKFAIQHINPFYLFFFPFKAEDRAEINNPVCSVGDHGFRGPGPADAGGRKLAFLLGGSSAFSVLASSNETTITGYLNSLQSEYLFINAGVPSWNSNQELHRLTTEILRFQPALIVAYDGANDLATQRAYHVKGFPCPPATPENFDTLSNLVDDIRGAPKKSVLKKPPLYQRLFPSLTTNARWHLDRRFGTALSAQTPAPPMSDEMIDKVVDTYIFNLSLMNDLAKARGARFIAILQPIRALHLHVEERYLAPAKVSEYQRFHRLTLEKYRPTFEFHDFSKIFDAHYAHVQSGEAEYHPDNIFADEVHLYDKGNAIIAGEILKRLQTTKN